jgi:hypothetical protein
VRSLSLETIVTDCHKLDFYLEYSTCILPSRKADVSELVRMGYVYQNKFFTARRAVDRADKHMSGQIGIRMVTLKTPSEIAACSDGTNFRSATVHFAYLTDGLGSKMSLQIFYGHRLRNIAHVQCIAPFYATAETGLNKPTRLL